MNTNPIAQALGCVSHEQFGGVGHLVFDALPTWLRCRPELEILEAVVRSIAIDVMHHLVRPQGSLKVLCHYEPVFGNAVLAVRQVSQFGRHRHVPVSVIEPTLARDDSYRDVGLGVTMLQSAGVVRAAVALGLGGALAVGDSAHLRLPAPAERDVLLHVTAALPALVVAVAQAAAVSRLVALRH